MIIVNQSVAHPWECDVMGHMTTRFYVAKFDDASYHFLVKAFGDCPTGLGWVDVRHELDYMDEVLAGDLLEIHAGLLRIGGSSVVTRYDMVKVGQSTPLARLQSTSVLFDLEARKSSKLNDSMRSAGQALLIPNSGD